MKEYSKITVEDFRGNTRYSVGINHTFRRFESVARFLANIHICLGGKPSQGDYGSFKTWIYTRKPVDSYQFRTDDEFWFDNGVFGYVLAGEWNDVDTNHYLLSSVYRFLDDSRHLPYADIGPERVCENIEDNAILSWKQYLGNQNQGRWLVNDYVLTLGVPQKMIHTLGLYRLAKICPTSYISFSFPLSGTTSMFWKQLETQNDWNEEDVKNVLAFFNNHQSTVRDIHFGEYVSNSSDHMLYAMMYLGSIPNLTRNGRQTKGITRLGLTITVNTTADDSGLPDSICKLADAVCRAFNDNGYVYEQFKNTVDKRFHIKR